MSASKDQHNGQGFVVAIVGATGVVGREFLSLLSERAFPIRALKLLASERSEGQTLTFGDEDLAVETLGDQSFDGVDLAFFSAGSSISQVYVAKALSKGCMVIDNASFFRLHPEVPLIVPEINGHLIRNPSKNILVANPNCSTAQLVLALFPLKQAYGLKRVVVSTYQSTSGAGKKGMEELTKQVSSLFHYQEPVNEIFPHRIAFNLIPQIGAFDKEGFCEEERKIERETRKILGLETLPMAVTTVRVPTFHGHAESLAIEFEKPFESVDELRGLLDKTPGLTVVDEPQEQLYPLLHEIHGYDDVFVGRIRRDPSVASGALLWVCADNLRKGAALNAIQIAETLFGLDTHS